MSMWLLRGIVFAALMVIVRLLQGAMIGAWEKQSLIISVTLVVLYIVAAFVWGVLDGQSDAKAQPDPDRREDLAMAWLVGGLFAGVVSGFFAWLIGQFYDNIYVDALAAELTTFAAFTALIVFVGGVCGCDGVCWAAAGAARQVAVRRKSDGRKRRCIGGKARLGGEFSYRLQCVRCQRPQGGGILRRNRAQSVAALHWGCVAHWDAPS